jgi:hypothetical protein
MKQLRILTWAFLALAILLPVGLKAQTASFDQVLSAQLRNSGTIVEGSEVKGYYLFYTEDKLDRKTNQYRLRILDANLKDVASEAIVGPNTWFLMEGVFNGTHLAFKFLDIKAEKFQYRIYDTNAKFVKQVDQVANKLDIQVGYAAIETGEICEGSFFGIPNKGFINLKMVKEKDLGFEIQYFGKDRGFLGWTYKSDPTSTLIELADFLLTDENLLVFQVLKKKSILSSNMDAYLLGIDVATGKKKFENKLADATNSFFLLNGITDKESGNYFFFGQHTPLGDNTFMNKNLGFCGLQVDATGKIVKTTKISWANDVSKFLPVNQKGKIEEAGYVYFHKIIKMADGKVFAIGEQFKKTVSASGVAVNVLAGGGASNMQVTIEDMMIFEFSPDFKLEGVAIFEKGKSRVQIPQGAGINGAQRLAHYVKAYGGFDYAYSQVPLDNSSFTVFFQDWEKEKGEKGRMTLKCITPSGDTYTTDKIDLATEATYLRVQPAKPGYVLITEYFRKLKKMDSRLEKFNQ